MSEAAEKMKAWRRAKRQAGQCQLQYWFPRDLPGRIKALAAIRQQDPAACVQDAITALEYVLGAIGAERSALVKGRQARALPKAGPETGLPLPNPPNYSSGCSMLNAYIQASSSLSK